MLNRLSFGQYRSKDSFIHKLDPRAKLIYVIAFSFLVFFIEDTSKILFLTGFILILLILARMGIGDLIRNLRPFFFIFALIFAMYLLFSRNNLYQGIVAIWRFLVLIIVSLLLTYTTTTSNLVIAIEKLLQPLKCVNIKPRNFAVLISITIRFVPVMFVCFERTRDAMVSRLTNFRKVKNVRLLVSVLLEKMFKSASTLSDSMISRMYNDKAESSKILKLNKYDYISIIFILIIIIIIY